MAMTVGWTPRPHLSDVLVVGAGPAGIAAAERLARHGAKVTLIDRHFNPGNKACGGGLTRSAWTALGIVPDGSNRSREPSEQRGHSATKEVFWEMEVRSPLGRTTITTSQPQMMTFSRPHWTASRLRDLRELGVNIALGERFRFFHPTSPNVAVTDRADRNFGFLIGADGATSRVRAQIGLAKGNRMRGWQIRLPEASHVTLGLRSRRPVIWFDPSLFKSGYGWAFPYRDELRLGCGASSSVLSAKALKASFLKWLSKLGVSSNEGVVQSGTIGCHYAGHRFGALFLAGDAAGLASSLTGEGIYQALVSGREVAREILDVGYRSHEIPRLAFRHRRTHDSLSLPFLGRALYDFAPLLLRSRFLQKFTWSKYVY